MVNHKLLRLSSTLLGIFAVISVLGIFLHPSREDPNNYTAVFTEYAHSANWTAIHLIQFVGVAFLIAGLLVLSYALDLPEGAPRWLGFFGMLLAGVALAIAGVQYAVDGVALKQAVNAWVNAPAVEQAERLASAEAIRWLEWGVSSYTDIMLGLTLVLLAIVIVWSARIPWPIGIFLGMSGLGYIAKGWVIGTVGFAPIGAAPSNAAQAFLWAGILWLLVASWRRKVAIQPVRVPDSRYSG